MRLRLLGPCTETINAVDAQAKVAAATIEGSVSYLSDVEDNQPAPHRHPMRKHATHARVRQTWLRDLQARLPKMLARVTVAQSFNALPGLELDSEREELDEHGLRCRSASPTFGVVNRQG